MNIIREKKEALQRLLQAIGNVLVDVLPEHWTNVVVGYFIVGEEEIPHCQLHTITETSEDYIDLMEESWDRDDLDDAIVEVQDLCGKMRELCAAANDRWTSMTFTMQADGSFGLDFNYDPISVYDGNLILEWQSRYLDLGD